MQRMINTYIGGMDQDSSVNKFNPKNYFEAWNLSPLSIDGLSNAAMNNVKGNSPFYNCPYYVIGHCVIRNYVVIFMTSCTDAIGGTGYIYKMDTDTNIITQVKIGAFKFSTQYPIYNETAGYYERSDVIKVYWTDNFNCLRFINIMDPPTDIKECDIVQDISFGSAGRIYLESTAGGNLLSGRVQYSYQCYNINGSQSVFSPASPLYNIAGSSYNATNDEDFKGSPNLDDTGVRVNAGKSFVLRIIGADTSFDRVRVVAIHYNVVDAVPEIRVIGNYPVSSSIKFLDDGRADYGTITLEEYRTLGGDVFTAKSISVKDNILFAANVKNKYFDCDFDARAYRFNKTNVCKVYDRYGVLHTIIKSAGTWPTPVYTMGGSPVSETHDCICPYNYNVASNIVEEISTWAISDGYKYQSNGTTLGGEGPNVKYNFTIKDIYIRSYNVYANKNYVSGYVGLVDPKLSGEYCGYKRDEIYRFGLVLFNAKGQQSFVKWIGDIRMPTASDFYPIAYKEGSTGSTRANILGVEFYIDKSSLPVDVVSFEIVRVHRTQSDKTIMCSGIISQTNKDTMGGVADCYHPVLFPKYKTYSWGLYTPRYEIINLISPEVSFYKNQNFSSGDYLKTAGRVEERHHTNYSEGFTDLYMLHGVEPSPIEFSGTHYGAAALCYRQVAALTYLDVAPVIDFKILGYVDKANISANIETFPSYKYVHFGKIRPSSSTAEAPIGTALVAEMSVTPISLTHIGGDDNLETYYVDYKKNNVLSIYGGLNYDDRIQNTYIPCCTHYWLGNVVNRILKSAYSNEAIYTYGGDTYINSFKHLRAIFSGADIDMDGTPEIDKNNRYEVTVTFPVESTINIVYANGENIDNGTVAEHLGMQDQAGDHPIRITTEPLTGITALSYDQEEDMYLYNSVYSQMNSGKEFYSEPVSWVAISENDTRIKNSNTKIANEEIDSWLQFLTDNIIDVDSSYGPINKILRFKNHMLFFQDRGVGTLSVNERQLVPVENNAALELGTGGVLDRFDMIATGVGCQHREAIIATDLGFYWLDWKKRALYRYNQNAEDITSVKGMMSYMNNIVDVFTNKDNPLYTGGIMLIKNPMFKDVWITFFDSTYKRSLVYNEMYDGFTFFHRSVPCYSINVDNKLYTTLDGLNIYQENIGDFGYFFGTAYPSNITLVVNPLSNIVSAFHNFEFTTDVWDGVTDVYNETFNLLRVYNNYQDSGLVTMVTSGVGMNIRRRLRTWRINVPRDGSFTRMRDSYMKVFIERTNNLDNKRFVLHDVHTLFDVPAETLIVKQQQ